MTGKRYDFHTHTRHSDGRNSVKENVRMAEAGKLAGIAIADHHLPRTEAPAVPVIEDLSEYLEDIESAGSKAGIEVLAGAEAMLLNLEGEVSISPEDASRLDVVLVDMGYLTEGVAKDFSGSKDKLLSNYVKSQIAVCENSFVDVIAHPFNLGRLDVEIRPSDFPDVRVREIAGAFSENSKVFEIMNQMPFWFPLMDVDELTEEYARIVEIFAEENVRFCMGSDAHSAGAVGNLGWAGRVAESAGVAEDLFLSEGMFPGSGLL